MKELLSWFLVVEVVTAISFPFAFTFFSRLPDRGYSFAKVLGLLLIGFFLFTGATIGVIANNRGAVILILLILAAGGAYLAARRREEIRSFLAERWGYILPVEGLFLVTFAAALWLRSFVPDLSGTEKPSEFAFLNAVLRSDDFPAYDPWLTDFSLSYYYFGFVMVGALIKLTGVPPEISFNVAVALIAALTCTAAFGVVYNLVRGGSSERGALAFGFVGLVLVALLSNIEGLFELMAAHRIGPSGLYTWLGIEGLSLDEAGGTNKWYPDKGFFWWRSTRIPSNWDIKEYPFFSMLLGDLHPHYMVMPFSLMGIGVAHQFLRLGQRLDARWGLRNWGPFLLTAVAIGGLAFLNAWSFPPLLALAAIVVFAANWRANQGALWPALKDTASFIVPLAIVSFLLYLPFYITASGAVWPLKPVAATKRDFLPLYHAVTHPKHLFISWGAFLWLAVGLGASVVGWRWLARQGSRAAWALLPAAVPIALWVLWSLGRLGGSGLVDELDVRGPNLLTLLLLSGVVAVLTLALVRTLSEEDAGGDSLLMALAVLVLGTLLILGTELFYVSDHVGQNGAGVGVSRENTVFKLWHHAWLFLAIGGAFALHYLLKRLPPLRWPTPLPEVSRLAWISVAVVLIAAGFVLPVTATFNRTGGFTQRQSLDGLAFLRTFQRDEYDAVLWFRQNVPGSPVILEATDNPFTEGGRFSSRTGLPTVLEWPLHEEGYRGPGAREMLRERLGDVERAFTSANVADAQAVIDKYDVEYVIIGGFERQKYPAEGVDKFRQFLKVAYENPSVTVYRVPLPASGLVAAP